MTLKTDIDQLAADAALLHDIIHGPDSATVTTEGGAVKTIAKAVADAIAYVQTLGVTLSQNPAAVAVTGGAIDNTPIGNTTRSTGKFTTVHANTSMTAAASSGGAAVTGLEVRNDAAAQAGSEAAIALQANLSSSRWLLRAVQNSATANDTTLRLALNGVGVPLEASGAALIAPLNFVVGNGGSNRFVGVADDAQYMRLHGSNAVNQGGGIILFGGASVAPNVGRLVSQAATALEWNAAGNVGVGGAPEAWSAGSSKALQVGGFGVKQLSGANTTSLVSNAYYDGAWKYKSAATATRYDQYDRWHTWYAAAAGAAAGDAVTWAQVMSTNSYATTAGASTAACALYMHKDTTTSRSINAAGTINASGADYAEYERKATGCGLIAKADIVGRDADGRLVTAWSRAVTYGVKSTDPNLVGGDVWGNEAALGAARPEPPFPRTPDYQGSPDPGPAPEDKDLLPDWETAASRYRLDRQAHAARVATAAAAHAALMVTYAHALADFESRLELARQAVDRIAYAGKVPVNVLGAAPGDYIVAAEGPDDSIVGQAVAANAIDFAAYRLAVGRVHRILDDGRAEIAVIVH